MLNSPRRRKKVANLSVDERLLERARRLKLNLSQVFEDGLTEAIRRRKREEWLRGIVPRSMRIRSTLKSTAYSAMGCVRSDNAVRRLPQCQSGYRRADTLPAGCPVGPARLGGNADGRAAVQARSPLGQAGRTAESGVRGGRPQDDHAHARNRRGVEQGSRGTGRQPLRRAPGNHRGAGSAITGI